VSIVLYSLAAADSVRLCCVNGARPSCELHCVGFGQDEAPRQMAFLRRSLDLLLYTPNSSPAIKTRLHHKHCCFTFLIPTATIATDSTQLNVYLPIRENISCTNAMWHCTLLRSVCNCAYAYVIKFCYVLVGVPVEAPGHFPLLTYLDPKLLKIEMTGVMFCCMILCT